jgi:glycosyltransferase involved in cell wall biosynthesis
MHAERLCLVRHGYYPADVRVRREAEALVDAGYEVDLICLRAPGEPARERVGGVGVLRLPMTHRRAGLGRYLFEYTAFPLAAALVLAARQVWRRYDVVQVHTMPDHLVFSAAVPKLMGARVILDLHEAMPELYKSKFGPSSRAVRIITAIERASVAFADRVLVVSEPHRDVIASHGIPREKLTIVMNAPDERLFAPLSARRSGNGSLVLVSHGTLVDRYGYETAIRALAIAREELPNAQLLIIGEGEDAPRLRAIASELGLDDRVRFLGSRPIDEISSHIAGADIGVVANELDEFTDIVVPTKLMEYVVLGVPAVVARSQAVEAYFDEGSVRFFAPGDPRELARALVEVAGDPRRARARARRAAKAFLADHGWSRSRERYLALVAGLSRRAPR